MVEGAAEDQSGGVQRLLCLFGKRVGRDHHVFARMSLGRAVIEPRYGRKQHLRYEDRTGDEQPRGEPGMSERKHPSPLLRHAFF
jgi:hypothetical protein